MSTACDPKGKCPQCGYQNGAGMERCLRCRAVLFVPQGCNGACAACLIMPTAPPPKAPSPKEAK